MEKRLIIAIALSMLVLMAWSRIVPKSQPIESQELAGITTEVTQQVSVPAKQTALVADIPSSSLVTLSNARYDIVFIESQAAIKEVVFKDYQSSVFALHQGFAFTGQELVFSKEKFSEDEARFVYKDQNKRITKSFVFYNSNYDIELEIAVENLSGEQLNLNLPLTLGILDFGQNPNTARFQDVTAVTTERILHPNARKTSTFGQIKFLGLRNRYFCAIIEPDLGSNDSATIRKINARESEIGLALPEIVLGPRQKASYKFRIYLGPQELQTINQANREWSAVMYYGTFDLIANVVLHALEIINKLVHNWGATIILLSILIYLVLFPLTLKQMRSMKAMQVVQPHIEELRKMYKDNPQRLNKEIMELYREHKVNPLGGCLPMLLQIPVFFALYQVLSRSIALKGASFLWIKDLSEPDRLFILPKTLPILGNEINILPIVMAIGMFVQQKISTAATSSVSAEQQKLMMILFPVMFGVIFYHMPSGLVLYWFINSTLMLAYQFRMNRAK